MMDVRGRLVVLAIIAAAGTGLGGCVAQGKYDNTETSARALEARNQELLQNNEALETMLRGKDQRIAQLESEKNALEGRVGALGSQLGTIEGSMSDLDRRLGDVRLGGLDPSTDRALRELAGRYPDLLSYDANRGMIRLGSDLGFDSGSDVVKPQAATALAQLAGILTGSDAGNYDVRVVGHTDSQQPSRSANRHPTNRHLSVHRSIAVTRVLESNGVRGARVEVAGWGEFRPAVPNSASGGTPGNRRVEIYLVPSSAPVIDSGAPVPAPTTSQPRDVPMK
jgi:chemotaxis protein MotB